MNKNIHHLLLKWSAYFLISILLLATARSRLLLHSLGSEYQLLNILWITAEDAWALGLIGALCCVVFRRREGLWLASLTVVYSFFGVQFQTKMSEPLTRGLLGQMGGIFEMSASIQSASYLRSYLFIGGGICSFYLFWFLFQKTLTRSRLSFQKPITIFALTLFIFSPVFSYTLPTKLEGVSSNPILLLMRRPPGPEQLLTHPLFSQLKARPIQRVEHQSEPKKWNVVFLLMETLEYKLIQNDSDFQKIMPHLYALKNKFTFYRRHFTPWPLSSKSIFSVICSDYPYPSNFIEIRILPDRVCNSWMRALAQAGYATWTGYSGEKSYDQMGKFFKTQGIQTFQDRLDFSKLGDYQGTSWGLDDRALVEGFGSWVAKTSQPFSALLIPINSHHPYWTPDPAFKKFDDDYKDAFHYQDALIQNVFDTLTKHDLWKNTIVIITGDHGRRFSPTTVPGTLPQTAFHVPLWVYLPWESKAEVTHATSHIDFGGSILNWTGVKGSYLEGHLLSEKKSAYMYYDAGSPLFVLADENSTSLFNGKQGSLYRGKHWVTDLNSTCDTTTDETACVPEKQKLFDILSHSIETFSNVLGRSP